MYFKPLRRLINQRKARLLKKGMRRKMATARSIVDQATNQ
jgi:ABC-type Na+ transport system ATPase subunit NatA